MRKLIEIKHEEAQMNMQEAEVNHCEQLFYCFVFVMACVGLRIWLPNTDDFFRELVNFVVNAEQNRAACDSPDFYCRRLEQYQHTLSVLTRRITESYHTEQELISNLEVLLNYLNTLRNQFEALSEIFDRTSAQNLLQESYDQSICLPEYNGRVGRPRIHVTQEQLNILHNTAGFRWADIGRILGVSERTIRRRRHQFGLVVGRETAFSNISDNDLDNLVREILITTPSSGGRLVEGSLRSRGLCIQRRRVQESIRRVDPVIRTLRSARTTIRRVYNVPSPNALW
jgi:hypothetical protein